MGVATLSLFASSAYAQAPVGGLPVPTDSSGLFLSLMQNNVLWIATAAGAGLVIYKTKSKLKN